MPFGASVSLFLICTNKVISFFSHCLFGTQAFRDGFLLLWSHLYSACKRVSIPLATIRHWSRSLKLVVVIITEITIIEIIIQVIIIINPAPCTLEDALSYQQTTLEGISISLPVHMLVGLHVAPVTWIYSWRN